VRMADSFATALIWAGARTHLAALDCGSPTYNSEAQGVFPDPGGASACV